MKAEYIEMHACQIGPQTTALLTWDCITGTASHSGIVRNASWPKLNVRRKLTTFEKKSENFIHGGFTDV